jgi:hypothetical protein
LRIGIGFQQKYIIENKKGLFKASNYSSILSL